MRGILIAAAILCTPALARAQSVDLQGWTSDGDAVVHVGIGAGVWDQAWLQGAPDPSDFWAVCTPHAFAGLEADGGADGCKVCSDAASCGVATDASGAKPAKVSPDKKIKIKDKRKCVKDPDEYTKKSCTRTITFGKAGALQYQEGWSGDKAKMQVYFRPDSRAAVVSFATCNRMDTCWPTMYVVALGGASSSSAAATTYAFGLEHLKEGKSEGPSDADPVAYRSGSVDVVLTVTTGGKAKKIPIEHLDLSLHGDYDMGEALAFDSDFMPKLDILSVDTAAAIKAHLPAGTVAAAGYIDEGERAYFKFVVYAVVVDGKDVRVIKQRWSDQGSEPDDQSEVKL